MKLRNDSDYSDELANFFTDAVENAELVIDKIEKTLKDGNNGGNS